MKNPLLSNKKSVSRASAGETLSSNLKIDESVDLIGFSFEVKAYEKFYHRHMVDIPRIKFFV